MLNPPAPAEKTSRASMGAFALSIVVHGAVILLVGGYVIFEGVVPKSPFLPAEVADYGSSEAVIPEPDQPVDNLETPTAPVSELQAVQESVAAGEATSSDILVSSGINTAFTLPPAVGAPSAAPKLGFGSGTPGKADGTATNAPKSNIIHSIFGSSEASPSSLRGTMYDLKQDRKGNALKSNYNSVLRAFVKNWDLGALRDFYKVDTELYATHLYVPLIDAQAAPKAFQVQDKVQPSQWIIVYEGSFTAPASKSYRFVGYADDVLVVHVNGKIVMDGSRSSLGYNSEQSFSDWELTEETKLKHKAANGHLAYGDWMKLEAGQPNKISILFGERPGGQFCGFLFVEEQGKKYETDPRNGTPILPLFRMQNVEVEPAKDPRLGPRYEERGPIFKNS